MDINIADYSRTIKTILKHQLKTMILFGSRARGDFNPDSDYDFLIVLKNKEESLLDKIKNSQLDFLNQYDLLASCLVLDESEWKEEQKYPLGKNILKEGKIL